MFLHQTTSRWTTSAPHRPNHSPPWVRYSGYLVQGVGGEMCLNKLPLPSVDRNSTVTPSCLARPEIAPPLTAAVPTSIPAAIVMLQSPSWPRPHRCGERTRSRRARGCYRFRVDVDGDVAGVLLDELAVRALPPLLATPPVKVNSSVTPPEREMIEIARKMMARCKPARMSSRFSPSESRSRISRRRTRCRSNRCAPAGPTSSRAGPICAARYHLVGDVAEIMPATRGEAVVHLKFVTMPFSSTWMPLVSGSRCRAPCAYSDT